MKTILFALMLLASISCTHRKQNVYRNDEMVNPLVIHDTVFLIDRPEVRMERYFFVSYRVSTTDGKNNNYGNRWFDIKGFPSKKWIDSVIYKSLPLKKSCYQHIIITSIYEFKNHNDFDNYLQDYKGDPNPEKQTQCEN